MSTLHFSDLSLPKAQLRNLEELGYHQMTPIQASSLPTILKGGDLIGQAQTGSGKTAAFGIGLLEAIDLKHFTTQGLVICPTRELAEQVRQEIRRLGRYLPNLKISAICGGVPIRHQIHSLSQHAPHIAVGTPGRLLDHLGRGTLDLSYTKVLVLDEADRMLDMGFADEVAEIIRYIPKKRQTLLFSATFPEDIRRMSRQFQHRPKEVVVEALVENRPKISQSVVLVEDGRDKPAVTAEILYHYRPQSSVIFCNTIATTIEVTDFLQRHRIDALALHGDLDQKDRDQVLIQFSNRSCPVLVATDVAARGLDIDDLSLVLNFDVPFDPEVYVHRIGRTGRAGKEGRALTFSLSYKQERIEMIEAALEQQFPRISASDLKGTPAPLHAEMVTIEINEGRKAKISAGDILGALTANEAISGSDVGKITLLPMKAYVAIKAPLAKVAVDQIWRRPIKGIECRARVLRSFN